MLTVKFKFTSKFLKEEVIRQGIDVSNINNYLNEIKKINSKKECLIPGFECVSIYF